MAEPISIAEIEHMLGMKVDPKMTVDELLCWLKAKQEDILAEQAQKERDAGGVALADLKLFFRVAVQLRLKEDVQLNDVIRMLRSRKRLGHVQRLALETWDQHYEEKDVQIPIQP